MMEGPAANEEQIGESGPQPNRPEVEAKHSHRSHAIKRVLGGIMPSGKRESIFTKILLAIILIWVVVWATNRGYPFWPGLAGVLTIPLLLVALVVDNLSKE